MVNTDTAIGGYFGLELNSSIEYHKAATISLNTGRNCLEMILRSRDFTKIYLPYYMCEVLFEPIKKLGIDYVFYELDSKLEPILLNNIGPNEVLFYINYFGLKQSKVEDLAQDKTITNLIIDNSQAFFSPPIIKDSVDTFYSARKFFGVPDGAYLYTTQEIIIEKIAQSSDRGSHLLKRLDQGSEFGFNDFQKNEGKLVGQPIMKMSNLTKQLMCSINYNQVKATRRNNFKLLERELSEDNKFSLSLDNSAIPMVYPYYTDDLDLRNKLINNKVFVAKYWPNIAKWSGINLTGINLADHLLPLPLDQRYSELEMRKIINLIKC